MVHEWFTLSLAAALALALLRRTLAYDGSSLWLLLAPHYNAPLRWYGGQFPPPHHRRRSYRSINARDWMRDSDDRWGDRHRDTEALLWGFFFLLLIYLIFFSK